MDEKIFELLEQMYSEMQNGFKDVRTEFRSEFKSVRSEIKDLRIELKQDIARLENKMDNNHKALYDGYIQNSEDITEIKDNLEKLTDRVENQEIKLQVIKVAK
jgi:uncharacterized phage infection (PIP) family protein YhgE